jgi:hypothetical protein
MILPPEQPAPNTPEYAALPKRQQQSIAKEWQQYALALVTQSYRHGTPMIAAAAIATYRIQLDPKRDRLAEMEGIRLQRADLAASQLAERQEPTR